MSLLYLYLGDGTVMAACRAARTRAEYLMTLVEDDKADSAGHSGRALG